MTDVRVKLDAEDGGGYRVFVDGVVQEGYHTEAREAGERALNLKLQGPDRDVWYEPRPHRVVASVETDSEPSEPPEPEPEPDPEPEPGVSVIRWRDYATVEAQEAGPFNHPFWFEGRSLGIREAVAQGHVSIGPSPDPLLGEVSYGTYWPDSYEGVPGTDAQFGVDLRLREIMGERPRTMVAVVPVYHTGWRNCDDDKGIFVIPGGAPPVEFKLHVWSNRIQLRYNSGRPIAFPGAPKGVAIWPDGSEIDSREIFNDKAVLLRVTVGYRPGGPATLEVDRGNGWEMLIPGRIPEGVGERRIDRLSLGRNADPAGSGSERHWGTVRVFDGS